MYSKDMALVYSKKTDMELRKLRSKKILKMNKLASYNSYFARRDRNALSHQISQIDAELECRAAQQKLF